MILALFEQENSWVNVVFIKQYLNYVKTLKINNKRRRQIMRNTKLIWRGNKNNLTPLRVKSRNNLSTKAFTLNTNTLIPRVVYSFYTKTKQYINLYLCEICIANSPLLVAMIY